MMPKEGEPRTKDFEGKHYHVDCDYHPGQWVCHTTLECSKNPANSNTSQSSAPPASTPAARRLKAAQLAAALLEDEDDDEGEPQTDGN